MSDAPEGEPKPAPAGPRSSKLVPLLLLLNLGGTGFVAYETLQGAGAAGVAIGSAHAAEEERPKNEVGPVTALEPFIVNLNEPEATRYLKATFELEVSSAETVHELEKLKRPVRDEVLRYLSSLSVADTQGEKGKAKIQEEVVKRIDQLLGGGKVKKVVHTPTGLC